MPAQSFLAHIGIRLGTLGSPASLAIAAPLSEGDCSQAAHTDASRIGVFFDRTPGSAKMGWAVLGFVVMDIAQAGVAIYGNLTKLNNVPVSFPAFQGAAGSVLQNDGFGNLVWAAGFTPIGAFDTIGTAASYANRFSTMSPFASTGNLPNAQTNIRTIQISGDYMYVGTFATAAAGVTIYNIKNPVAPVYVGYIPSVFPTSGQILYMQVQGTKLYCFGAISQIAVIDISNPALPTLIGRSAAAGAGSLYMGVIVGSYIYVASQSAGLLVFDNTGSVPVLVFTQGGGAKSAGIAYANGTIFTTQYVTAGPPYATHALNVWNISVPATPTLTVSNNTILPNTMLPGSIWNDGVNNTLYIGDRASTAGRMALVDVTTPATPTLLSLISTVGTYPYNGGVWVLNNRWMYTFTSYAATTGGFQLWDIANKSAPVLLQTTLTGVNMSAAVMAGQFIYFGDVTNNAVAIYTAAEQSLVVGSLVIGGAVVIAGVSYKFPTAQGAAGTTLRNDGSGNLSWAV